MKFPYRIKKGLVSVYRIRTRVLKNRKYYAYELRYPGDGGKLVRRRISSRVLAIKEAKEIGERNKKRSRLAVGMTEADQETFARAVMILHATKEATDFAMSNYAKAHALTGGRVVEAAELFAAQNPDGQVRPSVAAAVEEFLKVKIAHGIGERQKQTLRIRLRIFARAFQCKLASVGASMVEQWLSGLEVKNRTRNNYLGDVRNFFTWARKSNYTQTDLSGLNKSIVRKSDNQIWRPAEMRLLLETARSPFRDKLGRMQRTDEELIPFLAVGAFAKVRTAELLRLDWSNVRWSEGVIVVRRNLAKTKVARKIVMTDNLVAWLKPYAKLSGPLLPLSDVHKRLRRLARRAGLAWRHNALRNSGSTYHAILSKDFKLVSREAGNSPAILESEYLEIETASEEDARAWFNIFPDPAGGQILHLPLFAS